MNHSSKGCKNFSLGTVLVLILLSIYGCCLPCCLDDPEVVPGLEITMSMPSDALICDTIPVTLVITNTGTGIAHNITVKESLPSGLRTLDGETSLARNIGSLRSGESKEIAINVRADKTGSFDNIATASSESCLSAESNTTNVVITQPVLAISKTCTKETYVGLDIKHNIEVTNESDAPAASTVVEDRLPANTTFVSASDGGSLTGGTVAWNLGTLQPKESRSVSLVLNGTSIGEGENTATAYASCAEAVSDSCTTLVKGISAILLEVSDIEDPINVGSDVTYVITVTNQGSAIGTNITIACTLEDGKAEYVSSSGPTTGSGVGNVVAFGPLLALAPKEKASWSMKVRAVGAGDIRFGVKMNSDQIDRDVEETEATHFYE